MRHVMLHLMHRPGKALPGEAAAKCSATPSALALVAQAVQHHAQIGPLQSGCTKLLAQVGLAVLVDGDMVHSGQGDAGFERQ